MGPLEESPLCSLCNSVKQGAEFQKKGLRGYKTIREHLEKLQDDQTLNRVKETFENSELYVHKECLLSLFNKSKAAVRSSVKEGKTKGIGN